MKKSLFFLLLFFLPFNIKGALETDSLRGAIDGMSPNVLALVEYFNGDSKQDLSAQKKHEEFEFGDSEIDCEDPSALRTSDQRRRDSISRRRVIVPIAFYDPLFLHPYQFNERLCRL